MLVRILKEPLLHFLVLALLIFLVFDVLNPPREEARVITISEGRVEQLRARFESTWLRPPSDEEMALQVRNYALDEIYSREARALGLDQNDAVVKRRLRQKMEFMLQDITPREPTRDEIETFFAKNDDRYRSETRYSFEQVFVSLDRETAELEAILDAQQKQIESGARPAGDNTLLPAAMNSASKRQIERQFGTDFLLALADVPSGVWHGPVRSGLGMHFVRISRIQRGELPALETVYAKVLDDWKYEKRSAAKSAFETALLERYEVRAEGGSGAMSSADL